MAPADVRTAAGRFFTALGIGACLFLLFVGIIISVIAMIAMAPLITIQILGLIFKYLEDKKKRLDQEESSLEKAALERTAAKALPTFDSKEYTGGRSGENGPGAAPERD